MCIHGHDRGLALNFKLSRYRVSHICRTVRYADISDGPGQVGPSIDYFKPWCTMASNMYESAEHFGGGSSLEELEYVYYCVHVYVKGAHSECGHKISLQTVSFRY